MSLVLPTQGSTMPSTHLNEQPSYNQAFKENDTYADLMMQCQSQLQPGLDGEDDPSPESEYRIKADTYEDLSSSDEQQEPDYIPVNANRKVSKGAMSSSDLQFEELNAHQLGDINQHQLKNERQNIMAKLGDFSMSGMSASNIGGMSNLRGMEHKDELDDLSEISSGLQKQRVEQPPLQAQEEPDDDPNSLENRLKNIRKGLNFDYKDINLDQN